MNISIRFLIVIAVVMLVFLAGVHGLAAGNPGSIVLVNGTLIDGTGSEPVKDGAVVVKDGKIVAAGQRTSIAIPPDARIIDVHGGTILPGLINAHVHYGYAAPNLAAWARSGVTTVRDESILTQDSVEDMLKLRENQLNRPEYARLIACGKGIGVPGGYGMAYIDSPEEGRRLADHYLDLGADFIKITQEDGYGGNSGLPKLDKAEMTAIIEAAHRRGVPVSIHTTQAKYMAIAVECGVDDINHMAYDRVSDDLIAEMVAKGIAWIPTFTIYQQVPVSNDVLTDNLRRFVKAGGQVALGNDYGWPRPVPINGPPVYELEEMAASGMTPMQIIMACTSNGARVCRRDKVLGTLEPGKIADVLVVEGDPLKDVRMLTKVKTVIKDGVVIREPK